MFIKSIHIKNFRLFSDKEWFKVNHFNIPDYKTNGSGLNLFIGENGCGKTTLLDAISLPVLEYKTESFSINDLNNPNERCYIKLFSEKNFEFKAITPKAGPYKAKGFEFEAGIKSRGKKSYLDKIITTDQRFIRADGEVKPKDGTPDLRLSVNNPWSGKRFTENDFLYLDKNRIFHIRTGIYNTTRFDRLMEDFDYQYIKSGGKDKKGNPIDNFFELNENLTDVKKTIENEFLSKAVQIFNKLSNLKITLNYIDNFRPHKKAFFAFQKENGQQIPIEMLGSGYEMIFSLIYSFYLAKQSGKELIILIDEPELHLHPKLQEKFVDILLEFSKESQIILATQSPLFIKQSLSKSSVKIYVLKKLNEKIEVLKPKDRVLPYLSANEINFIAFGLATEEYHNELYAYLQSQKQNLFNKKINKNCLHNNEEEAQKCSKCIPYKRSKNTIQYITLSKYIRHQIHHPENKLNKRFTKEQLKESIKFMRSLILNNN